MENQSNEINNLKKFGKTFQDKCLGILVSDRAFLERIADILSPDYFETDAHKWIISFLTGYFPKYREIPTMEVFAVEIQKIPDSVMQAAVKEQVKAAYRQVSASDTTYVKEQFLEFCKNQKLKNAIEEASHLLNKADYEGIWKVIDEASKAGIERDLGHDYYADIDQRMSESVRDVIKTNWDLIDTHLDGGLGKGELGFIVAPAGSGKSWFLSRIGVEAMRQGKNVMHFTMELNQKYVGLRYDACITGFAFQEVRKNATLVKEKITQFKTDGGGQLFVKYFPLKTASAATLKMYIDRLQLITGIKIDLIVVDYADILRPFVTNKDANSYNESGNVYEELRTILGELQIPGWTASQANRGAHEKDVTEAGDVADSYRKIMTGDFIMSLSRQMEDKIAGTGRVHVMKSRFGGDGITYPCAFDAGNGKISIYDGKSVEGMEIINKAKSAQDSIKDILRKRWKETHGKDDAND
jgi:replicative DNA helicase